ncbi:ComEA family DNA-binding protein [uncultured Subdoligranulum sp.]|uniref:ComEA family DNA-binding protein n=1 Tax=uncultured Subdoligranulum sp. TaxID=512298 RepID=UPI0025F86F53|nr:ComEA family DNA-binding protein [uncultured Subdoligranulum sp.]
MSGKRRDAFGLLLATLLALGLILWGACFWIAPVWQWGYRPAAYEAPAAPRQESEETVRWPIDLNRADAQQLMQLPGIGEVKAAAILAYRAEHGAFRTVEELDEVRGISARMVESWDGLVEVGPAC